MIDRRTFVAGATLAAVVPVIDWLPPQLPADAPGDVVFAIDGWSHRNDVEHADRVWIRVGRSWRADWR
jgi:hypothetical protein